MVSELPPAVVADTLNRSPMIWNRPDAEATAVTVFYDAVGEEAGRPATSISRIRIEDNIHGTGSRTEAAFSLHCPCTSPVWPPRAGHYD